MSEKLPCAQLFLAQFFNVYIMSKPTLPYAHKCNPQTRSRYTFAWLLLCENIIIVLSQGLCWGFYHAPFHVAGGPLHNEEWPPHHHARGRSTGQPRLCDGSSQLCDEQLVHQPGVGPDRAVGKEGTIQDWGPHTPQEGAFIFSANDL